MYHRPSEIKAVDKDLDMLVVPKLKAEMVFGLRSLKENRCTLTFSHDEDFLSTGVKNGSMVPIRYLLSIISPKRIQEGRVKKKAIRVTRRGGS